MQHFAATYIQRHFSLSFSPLSISAFIYPLWLKPPSDKSAANNVFTSLSQPTPPPLTWGWLRERGPLLVSYHRYSLCSLIPCSIKHVRFPSVLSSGQSPMNGFNNSVYLPTDAARPVDFFVHIPRAVVFFASKIKYLYWFCASEYVNK